MADTLKLRGGTTSQNNSFTGSDREVTVDTTKKTLVVHDGSTAGGSALMKESGGNAASSVGIGTGGTNRLNISSSEVVFNENSSDTDFRIEGNGNTNLFRVDAGNDQIGINTGTPAAKLHLMDGDIFLTDNSTTANTGQGIYFQSTTSGWGTANAHAALFGKRVDGSNGYLRFDTRGSGTTSERLRIDSLGRALIGTSTPVMNESGFNEIVLAGKSEGAAIHLADDSNNVQAGMFTSDGGGGVFYIRTITNNPMSFRTNNTERFRIDVNGNLNFSMEAASGYPTQQIKWSNDSTTTSGFYIAQHSDRNGRIWHEQGLSIDFGTSNTNRMTIDPNGKVGIGTTTPAAELEVAGNAKITGSQIDFTALPTSDPNVAGRLWRDGTDLKVSVG